MQTATRPMIYLGDHTALTRTAFGHKLYVDTRDVSLAPHLLLDGFWEMWITEVFSRAVNPGMTVIDVGANLGYYSLLAATHVGPEGKVVSVEANPDVFKLMARSMEVNGFLDRTLLVNKGFMDKPGELTFHRFHEHQGSSGFYVNPAVAEQFRDRVDAIKVPCITLDEYVRGHLSRVDVVKIDAEGAEPAIIQGAAETLNAFQDIRVFMEYTIANRKAVDQLLAWGFGMWLVDSDATLKPISLDGLAQRHDCIMLYFSRE